ncbi:MAG: MOSC N-terminal beta barrel domain-containing protein [Cyclobacteriaceae bacterium]
MAQLILTEIWIYPVKSLGGIPLEKASVMGKGLEFDRRWMLIDDEGVFMTQRVNPAMALFKLRIQEGWISISYTKDGKIISSCEFSISTPTSDKWIAARVWNDDVKVLEVEPELSKWFSHHLQTSCKLVAFPEEKPRPVDPRYKLNNEQVSLADAYPFLIIGQSSLDDLNKKLVSPVPMNRFRPNFVFRGGEPYGEDRWRDLSIGKIPFVAVKKSERCVLTTVNQDTAEKEAEPLRTLSGYRKIENKVYFGQNLVTLGHGEVAIGDPVIPA